MGSYIYTNRDVNGGMPVVIDAEDVPKLEENEWFMHIMKIATVLEREGIDGVRIEWNKGEGDRYFSALLAKPGSLGERLLNFIAEEVIKTRRMPTIESAIALAKYVQKQEAAHYE